MSEQNKPPFILSDVLPEPNEYGGFVEITSAEFENTEVCDIRDIIAEHFEKKQIEEMARVISDICPFYKEYGTCEQCNTELDIDAPPCYWECVAKIIVSEGYRKESEVAREIFAEIERFLFDDKTLINITKFAELKKKYTGEVTENE